MYEINVVSIQDSTGVIRNVPVQWAPVSNAVAGDVTLVAAPSGSQSVYLLRHKLVVGGATNLQFFSGPSINGASITGPIPLVANEGDASASGPVAFAKTAAGTALVLSQSQSVQVSGIVAYAIA